MILEHWTLLDNFGKPFLSYNKLCKFIRDKGGGCNQKLVDLQGLSQKFYFKTKS